MEKVFTLGELIEKNVSHFQEEIVAESQTATHEHNLSNDLTKVEVTWKDTTFTCEEYKDKDHILTHLDELQETLDECLTDMNNIMGSRYVNSYDKLKNRAENMFESLSKFSVIFENLKDF